MNHLASFPLASLADIWRKREGSDFAGGALHKLLLGTWLTSAIAGAANAWGVGAQGAVSAAGGGKLQGAQSKCAK